MRRFILSLALGFFMLNPAASEAVAQDKTTLNVQVGQSIRSYTLYMPRTESGRKVPLVLAFHGGGGNGDRFAEQTRFPELAQSEGFAVAFMEGSGRLKTWNAVYCCGEAVKIDANEDVFVLAAIQQISTAYPIDDKRIYLVGHSNGGMNVQRLAERLAGRIAAAASVAGPRFEPVSEGQPVPFLMIQAKDDQAVPFEGGFSNQLIVRHTQTKPFLPAAETMHSWARRNGCSAVPTQEVGRQDSYVRYVFRNCAAPVEYYLLAYGAHPWHSLVGVPDRKGNRTPAPIMDTVVVWNFFKSFRLR